MEKLHPLSAGERDAYQRLPSALCIFEAAGSRFRPLLFSDGMCALVQSSRETLFSRLKDPGGAVHPDDAAPLFQTASAAVSHCGRPYSSVFRIAVKEGAYRRLLVQEIAVLSGSGVCLLYCQCAAAPESVLPGSPAADTAERKNARLTQILDSIPSGIAVLQIDPSGTPKSVSINRHMAQNMDLSGGDFQISDPDRLLSYVHPDDREESGGAFSRFLKTGEPLKRTVRLCGSGGKPFLWVHIEGLLTRHPDASSTAYMTYANVDAMKRTENALLNSRRIYENAVRSAQLMMWEYDIPRRRITFSQDAITRAECEKFGIPPVLENIPEALSPWFDQRDFPAILAMHRRVNGGEDASCDAWYQFYPGRDARCERISYTVVRDPSGQPALAYGLGRNITAERKMRERYQREMEYLKQNSDCNLIAKGHDSLTRNRVLEYTPLNDKAYPFVPNRTYDEACQAFLSAAYKDSDRKAAEAVICRENLLRRCRQGENCVSVQYRRAMHGRPPFWVSTVIHTYATPDTGDIEIFTYTYDITRRKQGEEIMSRIAETEFDYIGVLYTVSGTFEFIRKDPRILYPKLHEKVGYELCRQHERRNLAGADELAHFDGATALDSILSALSTHGRYTTTHKRTENGRLTCVQLNYSWLERESGTVLVVRSNVTAAYEREQHQLREVQQARLEAMRANEAKSAFLSSMSHDLRTPLNGILGFADIALRENDCEKQRDYLKKIQSSGGLLLNLVNDTLEMSRIESGKMTLEQEPVNVQALCETVLTVLRPSALQGEIRLTADTLRFPGEVVCTDRLRLQKILLNLLSNAIKYTPPGGSVALRVETLDPPIAGRTCRITVRDTGIGISGEFLPHLYEPFAQEHRGGPSSVIGTGLGLSIVKRILDLMNGTIRVDTEVGKGSRFTVELPLRPAASPGAPPPAAAADVPLTGRKILLCEDNRLNMEIASVLLRENGLEVDCAGNGKAGLEKFSASAPGTYDAILMDLRMPVMDGCAATRAIRNLPRPDAKSIPIVAMTADAFEEDLRRAQQAGLTDCVTKPVNPERLLAALRRSLT